MEKHQNTVVCGRVCMPVYIAPEMPCDEDAQRMKELMDFCKANDLNYE